MPQALPTALAVIYTANSFLNVSSTSRPCWFSLLATFNAKFSLCSTHALRYGNLIFLFSSLFKFGFTLCSFCVFFFFHFLFQLNTLFSDFDFVYFMRFVPIFSQFSSYSHLWWCGFAVIFLVFQGFGGKRSDCRIKEWFSNPWHFTFRRSIP